MIRFTQVCKRYNDGPLALNNVDFALKTGEMAFLTGHSGAGKSTLLKLILGLEQPSSGHVYVGQQDVAKMTRAQIPYLRRDIGIVFQNPHLLPDRTIFENVSAPLLISGYRKHDINLRVGAALEKVGLSKQALYLPQELSSGEQQRAAIARAVVNKPRYLLADEPTGNLDPKRALEMLRLFAAFNAVGVTVLIATHNLSLLDQFNARQLILSEGQLVAEEAYESV